MKTILFSTALIATVLFQSSASAEIYFRYLTSDISEIGIVDPEGPEQPGQPGEEPGGPDDGGDGSLFHSLTDFVVEGNVYQFAIYSDQAGDAYSFAARGLPQFLTMQSSGRLIARPMASDVGVHSGLYFTATDGSEVHSIGPLSIEVLPVGSATPPVMPTAVSAAGTLVDHKILYDGKQSSTDTYRLVDSEALVLTFDTPISANGAFLWRGALARRL